MTDTARARANAEQLAASDPAVSAFVAASAGSGKTKLLTDRLLRLMLGGAAPARIQCLTFTKAAAAEMALRLQRTLGEWVTLDDPMLDMRLGRLAVAAEPETRALARALFAEVLDLPGGMRIGTIHAFCQSLLRRFPIEANLPPDFRLAEDADARIGQQEARELVLASARDTGARPALETLAGLVTAEQFGGLATRLQQDRARLTRLLANPDISADQRALLGVRHDQETLIRDAAAITPATLVAAARRIAAHGLATDRIRARAAEMLQWLAVHPADRAEHWAIWRAFFLIPSDGSARQPGAFLNPRLATTAPELMEAIADEQARVLAVDDGCRAARTAAISAALVQLALPVARGYAAAKDRAGLLDYDDLIVTTGTLLVDPGASWVLYKLDGGLDHLLLDEVQDTSPAQWRIAGALTAEFFAGAGANENHRTIFAVGDPKQSIYSFQGADPAAFHHWRDVLRERVPAGAWLDGQLDVSFRSTAPVLALVDAVFADPEAARGVGATTHFTDRADHAGCVELWPLTPAATLDPPEAWTVPESNLGLASATERLARSLAAWIAGQCAAGTLAPGDVLVLVRRRGPLDRALLAALKAAGVPVAGLDRMVLADEPAVQDLLALCEALLLPDDDLTFACVLTSPLGGLSDDDLIALAPGRRSSLWQALRERADERPAWRRMADRFAALLARVDFITPHALLAEVLGPFGGRARLFARLGAEASEPIDELLAATLLHARLHPPSLQAFVHWLREAGAEIKREPEADAHGAGMVRIMTVHGAKGLQARMVILPDTTTVPPDDGPLLWGETDVPIWLPRKEFHCAASDHLRDEAARRRIAEYHRLLYVALTRAEDRVLVCGAAVRRPPAHTAWYDLIARGFARLNAAEAAFDAVADPWAGSVLSVASPRLAPWAPQPAKDLTPPAPPPTWTGAAPEWTPRPPPVEPVLPSPLAPSRPEGVRFGDVPASASPFVVRDPLGRRFARGRLIHALLQHLPELSTAERATAAARFASRTLSPEDVPGLVAEVLAVLDHPALTPLFGPGSRAEVPLTGVVANTVIGGLVDRLLVLPDRILLADYKTNREPPNDVSGTPVAYLRQLAAYRAVLLGACPGRGITCALIWTAAARVMVLPSTLLDSHAPA